MKVLLFGTGDYYERYKKWFVNEDVIALMDNSKEKQGKLIDGHIVLSPLEAIKGSYDAIIILSFYIKSMKAQLVELGVLENKIYHFFQLHDLLMGSYKKRKLISYNGIGKITYLDYSKGFAQKKIVLFSHDLNLGGPALALMNVALYLKSIGKDVIFVSMIDGPLAEKLLQKGIELVVDENLQIQTMNESVWQDEYQLIICNTFNYYVFLSERNLNIPVIWWLHDSRFFYDGVDIERLQSINQYNLRCVSVGPVPKSAIHEFIPDLKIEDLIYGTEEVDILYHKKKQRNDKIKFLIAGYIEYRKGQDILIEAIEGLAFDILEQCEFIFVGQNSSMMAHDLMERTKGIKEIKFIGTVGREEMHKMMDEMDVLICPSREDPMPTVCAEAMMHSKICVLSNSTGTSAFITDKVNGLVFKNQKVKELKEQIEWCVENKQTLLKMGIEARKVYEDYFSRTVFEKRLSILINAQI